MPVALSGEKEIGWKARQDKCNLNYLILKITAI
jgi:hypothetical protein